MSAPHLILLLSRSRREEPDERARLRARRGRSRDAARAEVDGFRRKSTMMPIRVDAGRQAKEAGQRAAPVFRPRFAWWRTGACSWGGATTRVSRLLGRARALVTAVRKVAPSLFDGATGWDFL